MCEPQRNIRIVYTLCWTLLSRKTHALSSHKILWSTFYALELRCWFYSLIHNNFMGIPWQGRRRNAILFVMQAFYWQTSLASVCVSVRAVFRLTEYMAYEKMLVNTITAKPRANFLLWRPQNLCIECQLQSNTRTIINMLTSSIKFNYGMTILAFYVLAVCATIWRRVAPTLQMLVLPTRQVC